MPSSVIRAFSYDAASKMLTVTFVSHRVYRYRGVPADVVAAFRRAPSQGTFFNARIRGRYPFEERPARKSA